MLRRLNVKPMTTRDYESSIIVFVRVVSAELAGPDPFSGLELVPELLSAFMGGV